MSNTTPPRFVPTLNQPVADINMPSTVADDPAHEKHRPEFSDSMIDLNLSELESGPSKVQHVPPLTEYQGSAKPYTPPVPPVSAASVAAAPVRTASPPPPKPAPVQAPGPQAGTPGLPPTMQLPADWQKQMQQLVQRSVRQELQQQMPFLLLQWSRQIEEHMAPQLEAQMVKLLQSWR